jgi:hypothetical protein
MAIAGERVWLKMSARSHAGSADEIDRHGLFISAPMAAVTWVN